MNPHNENNAIFFKRISKTRELTRSKFITLLFSDNYFNLLEETTFLLYPYFDCFSWQDVLYIDRIGNFENIFDYKVELQKKAVEALQIIDNLSIISNFEVFKGTCLDQSRLYTKLASISQKKYLDTLGIDDIKRNIYKCNIDLEIKDENGAEKLVFDNSREKRWTILKILDDDFLISDMTNLIYESSSKTPI